jgi:DNA-binding NtrC family response regulator
MSADALSTSNGYSADPVSSILPPDEAHLVVNVPTLEELERVHIRYVLERVRWHQGRAAAVLGISSKTLYRKIREYGFQRPPGPPRPR